MLSINFLSRRKISPKIFLLRMQQHLNRNYFYFVATRWKKTRGSQFVHNGERERKRERERGREREREREGESQVVVGSEARRAPSPPPCLISVVVATAVVDVADVAVAAVVVPQEKALLTRITIVVDGTVIFWWKRFSPVFLSEYMM